MKRLKAFLAAALAAIALGAGAHGTGGHHEGPVPKEQTPWGIAGDAGAASRTIEVTMTDDMRFAPDRIAVRRGETVRIVVHNAGAMFHEFVIGDPRTLREHAALMRRFPTMEHDEPYMAHVNPGATEHIVWTFNRPGRFRFACLVAGHYDAGMIGTIEVAPKPRATAPHRKAG